LSPLLCRRMLGTGRCALSVFGQHDALRQIGVDPTAETAIRAGDDIFAAGDRGVTQNAVGDPSRPRMCVARSWASTGRTSGEAAQAAAREDLPALTGETGGDTEARGWNEKSRHSIGPRPGGSTGPGATTEPMVKPMTPYSAIRVTRRSLPDLGRAAIPNASRGRARGAAPRWDGARGLIVPAERAVPDGGRP
jgi:hypothetical protein